MLVVHKYGGTSLKTKENRNCVLNNIKKELKKGNEIILVFSAIGRKGDPYATKELVSLVNEYNIKEESDLDMLKSSGEIIAISLMSIFLNHNNIKTKPLTAFQAGILTNSNFGEADIINIDTNSINKVLNDGYTPIIAGFQGVTTDGDITTIGYEGSDTTAACIAKHMGAKEVVIYTDVDGVYTSDPKENKTAKLIKKMTYQELINMSQDGAKIVHFKAPTILKNTDIKMYVRSAIKNNPGTLIEN